MWSRPAALLLAAGLLVNLGSTALWVMSRKAGVRFGLNAGQREAVEATGICGLCFSAMSSWAQPGHWRDPLDVLIALRIGRGTLRKVREDLGWAVGFNVIALPIAAGVFEPAFGLVLRPEIAALSISGSSFIVAVNALMLKRLKLPTPSAQTPN